MSDYEASGYEAIEKFVLAGIEAFDWPEGISVAFHGCKETDFMDMRVLAVRFVVDGAPPEDSEDREEVREMISALAPPHLRPPLGVEAIAELVAYNAKGWGDEDDEDDGADDEDWDA